MSEPTLFQTINPLPTDVLTATANRFEGKVRAAQGSAGDSRQSELKKVAQEFEAVFIAQLLKVMRETIEESGLMGGGFGKSIYTELFDQEVSLDMARRGTLGIADLLCRNLSASAELSETKAGETPTGEAAPAAPVQAAPQETGEKQTSECDISDLQLPVRAPLSSSFGLRRDPFSRQIKFHKGVDLAAPEGMKVIAALPGTVLAVGYVRGYGNTVLVQHDDGIQTRYAHLASIDVKAGDVIASQSTLGTVGDTGHSTGPHLHFEVIRMGRPVDPILSFSSIKFGPESKSSKIGG
jgi:murein DD-endopeptidase MepM/ murein hydrolase activator NlpD